jgi:hypothetical protein
MIPSFGRKVLAALRNAGPSVSFQCPVPPSAGILSSGLTSLTIAGYKTIRM